MNETGEQSLLNLLVYEEELVTLEIVLLIQLCLSTPFFLSEDVLGISADTISLQSPCASGIWCLPDSL